MTELETQEARDGQDVNVWVEIGRLQGQVTGQGERVSKLEVLVGTIDGKLDVLNQKADIAAGRAQQRAEDTSRLTRRLTVLISLAGLLLTALSILATIHFKLFGL